MSVSSGSDVTIRVQDSPSSSPPPPPSPYGNRLEQGKNVDSGLDNVAFEPDNNENEKKCHENNKTPMDKRGDHTKIAMNGQDPPLLNEALNSELIKLNIMNTIPDKPPTEFGPYENPDEYFIAVNQHKKFLRRSEKLYVTKDKRKGNPWKKYICWFFGAFILATIVTVAVLAGLGLISQKTTSAFTESVLGTTSSAGLSSSSLNPISTTSPSSDTDWISTSASTTSTSTSIQDDFSTSSSSPVPRPPLSDNYVPSAADVTLTLSNAEYTAALNNKSSDKFHTLATEIEQEMRNVLINQAGLSAAHAKVMEFLPGSVVIKMRLSWMDPNKELMDVQMFMSSLRRLNEYEVTAGATSVYGLVNHCKFGNYGCSHHCTFDYEQLDFICTCPEYLLLSDDKKQCIDNTTVSSTTEGTMMEPESSSERDEPHPEVYTEPPFVATTENFDHHMASTVSQSPPVTDAPIEQAPIHPISITTDESVEEKLNDTSSVSIESHEHDTNQSLVVEGRGLSTTESQEHGENVPIIPIVPVTTLSPDREIEVEHEQLNTSRLPTDEDEIGQTEKTQQEVTETSADGLPTEDPINETTIPSSSSSPLFNSNVTTMSDEESSMSNDALLQRTETDNYSEVEQHRHIVTRINTTTTGAPIISFNSSRYSEENNNNGSNLLSQEMSLSDERPLIEQQHALDRVLGNTNSSSESDAELISGDLVATGNGTRSKSARFESSFGDDQQQTVPLFHSQFINATARRVLHNSAEFMVYGDNILGGESPNHSQGGTDSGLTSDHQTTIGRFNLDLNETETVDGNNSSRESNITESEFSHNSGSVEVVSNESLAGSSSPKEDGESASVGDSDERASIVFSGLGHDSSQRPTREREEYTTTIPINLENDTLVNENATTEEGSNVEPVILDDESVATTPAPPTIEETVQEDGPHEPIVTENPKIVEDNVSDLQNSSKISTTQSPSPALVTEASLHDDLMETETTLAPPSSSPHSLMNESSPETDLLNVNAGSQSPVKNVMVVDDTINSTTIVSHIGSNETLATSNNNNHLTTIPTTTIKPTNIVSLNITNQSSPADNENELS